MKAKITEIACTLMARNIVLYKPTLSKILETKNPAIINPSEKDPEIIPIVPSEKFLYLARMTISVKKYPRPIPVNNAEIDKYFTLVLMLLKST